MQRYESYKPSGVKWLEDVPAHWEVRPGFTCFKENKDRNKGLVENTVLSLSYGRIVIKPEEKLTGLVPESFESYQLIKPGDIVIRTTDLQNDQTSLRVGYAKDKGMITSAYLGLRCHPEINPEYVFRLLESYDALKVFYGMGSGLRQNIDFWDFKRLPVPLPPRDEQDRIVAFLDQKTAEIDAAIAKKERLIELLSDQKKVLVQRAVTHGLSDGVPMRNSGVSWIGEIPAHWSIKRVRAVFKNLDSRRIPLSGEQRGKMTSRQYDYYGASGAIDKVDDYLFDEPLILIAEDGANLVMRNLRLAYIASGKYWVNNHAHILKPLSGNMTYLCEALECVDYNPLITGAAQPKLTKDALKGVEIPFPPPEEQSAIASFVSAADMKYKEIESRFIGEISLLANLKQATIANVVTGKIKV